MFASNCETVGLTVTQYVSETDKSEKLVFNKVIFLLIRVSHVGLLVSDWLEDMWTFTFATMGQNNLV